MSHDKPYGVRCYRSAASIFGVGEAWLKDEDGNIAGFRSLQEATAKAETLNAEFATNNTHYEAAFYRRES